MVRLKRIQLVFLGCIINITALLLYFFYKNPFIGIVCICMLIVGVRFTAIGLFGKEEEVCNLQCDNCKQESTTLQGQGKWEFICMSERVPLFICYDCGHGITSKNRYIEPAEMKKALKFYRKERGKPFQPMFAPRDSVIFKMYNLEPYVQKSKK